MSENIRWYLGFDFGASSGRAILGKLDLYGEKKLELEEVYRFHNEAVRGEKHLEWEIERLFGEMKTAINLVADRNIHIEAIGVDTWGVDFGIIDKAGNIVYRPVSYRDERTDGMMEEAYKIMPKAEIFKHTGLAFMQFNTLYQLLAMLRNPEERKYVSADYTLLFMPDLFEYYLTGKVGTEYTMASTSQLIDPVKRGWATPVLDAFGIPEGLFAPLQQPGSVRGMLRKEICPRLDYDIPVIAVGAHDTASAVAAVPAREGEEFAYISSGTWSLLGTETRTPMTLPSVMEANFTNEGGLNGTTRLLKNIMGLWIIQECRKQFNTERAEKGLSELSFADIVCEVESVKQPVHEIIDVDDDLFFHPDDMVGRICRYIKQHGGADINDAERVGNVADIVYRSLALKYRWGVEKLESITGRHIDALYIVGGGGKNELLNKYTAQAIMRPVRIGASEGTVIGNLLVQAMSRGDIKDIWELRKVVAASFGDKTYSFDPALADRWDEDYKALLALTK